MEVSGQHHKPAALRHITGNWVDDLEKTFLVLLGIEQRFFGCTVRSLAAASTTLSHLAGY